MSTSNVPYYKNDPAIVGRTAPVRVLYRPEIHFGKAALITIGTLLLSLIVAYLINPLLVSWNVFSLATYSEGKRFFMSFLLVIAVVLVFTLRFICVWFVRIYQRYARAQTRLKCCIIPSCSDYTILAFKRYGAIVGGIMGYLRIGRCGPPGYVDYPYKAPLHLVEYDKVAQKIVQQVIFPDNTDVIGRHLVYGWVDDSTFQATVIWADKETLSLGISRTNRNFKKEKHRTVVFKWDEITDFKTENNSWSVLDSTDNINIPIMENNSYSNELKEAIEKTLTEHKEKEHGGINS